MSQLKATSGPWRRSDRNGERTVVGGCGEGVALIPSKDFGLVDPAERESNARLIAASPDLYAALVAVLPYLEEGYLEDEDDDEPVGWTADNDGSNQRPMALTFGMVRRARAAIAKAEGQQ